MSGNPTEPRPWDRRPDESPKAYAAFTAYRDLGEQRSVAGAARLLGRCVSQFYRWATQYDWERRAHAWDLLQARQDEEAVRHERDEMVRRELKDISRLQQLAMAKFSALVRRDPATAELSLDPSVTTKDAVAIYDLTLKMQKTLAPAEAESAAAAAQDDPYLLADPELKELMRLARERAGRDSTPNKEDT